MTRKADKQKVIALRTEGMSYSQIQKITGVSKSTLSGWLSTLPLSKKRLTELHRNESVIEKIRLTKLQKRTHRLDAVFTSVASDIGFMTDRDMFIAGFFLYWAEGGKTTPYTITLSNTDPTMIRFYLRWLKHLRVPTDKIKIKLHLYKDMDIKKEQLFWNKVTKLSLAHFRKSYIKQTNSSDITYRSYGHGTCNIIVDNRDIAEYVHQGLKKIASLYEK